jgi:hypothetical protein
LRLAARRTEHVACAQGAPVLAAGEIRFTRADAMPQVREITNQSTGYCPEPESRPAVAAALETIGIARPDAYTQEFVFRRCTQCGQLNIVKDDWIYCGACDAALPSTWNID